MRALVLSCVLVFLLGAPMTANARCYLLVSAGQGEFNRSLTEKLEDRILGEVGNPHIMVQGQYAFERRSHPREYGGGCELGTYASVELAHFSGLETVVTGNYSVCFVQGGTSFCTQAEPMERRASLEGDALTLLLRYPLGLGWEPFFRLGAMRGVARVALRFPNLGGDPPLLLSIEERGLMPVVAVGVRYTVTPSLQITGEVRTFDSRSYSRIRLLGLSISF